MTNQDSSAPEAEEAVNPDDFKLPPLLRRRLVVELDIPRPVFDEKAIAIMAELQAAGEFDTKQMKEKWEFRLEITDNVPRPKLRLTHSPLLIRSARPGCPRTSLELFPAVDGRPARCIFEQDRCDEHPTRFEDLEKEVHRWLPRMMEQFHIQQVGGFSLLYMNQILPARYPEFWNEDRSLALGKVLKLFNDDYGGNGFVTPLSITLNAKAHTLPGSNLLFQVETSQEGGGFGLNLNLECSSLGKKQRIAPEQAWADLRAAHVLLFEDFVRHFTPEARKAFKR